MSLYTISDYRVNILLKHNSLTDSTQILKVGVVYYISKFKSPISLLVSLCAFNLVLLAPVPHVTKVSQFGFLSNLSYLSVLPFVFENVVTL
jgi:hypothetical protein